MDKEFMKLAIEEAKKSVESLKCGVVITKDERVIAKSHNTQRASNDASAHAEINAIRAAGRKIRNKNLENCTIYCTCEPCIMCLSAIAFAKIKKIIYGISLRDVSPSEKLVDIDIDTFLAKTLYTIEVTKNFMKEECSQLSMQSKTI